MLNPDSKREGASRRGRSGTPGFSLGAHIGNDSPRRNSCSSLSDIDSPSKTDHSFSETLLRWAQTLQSAFSRFVPANRMSWPPFRTGTCGLVGSYRSFPPVTPLSRMRPYRLQFWLTRKEYFRLGYGVIIFRWGRSAY